MHTSCAMMALSVTPSAEDEGVEVNGAVEAEGVAVYVWGSLGLSCASLRQTVAVFMAPITKKMRRDGKGMEKWRSIHVIAEGKMTLSQVAVSL